MAKVMIRTPTKIQADAEGKSGKLGAGKTERSQDGFNIRCRLPAIGTKSKRRGIREKDYGDPGALRTEDRKENEGIVVVEWGERYALNREGDQR